VNFCLKYEDVVLHGCGLTTGKLNQTVNYYSPQKTIEHVTCHKTHCSNNYIVSMDHQTAGEPTAFKFARNGVPAMPL